MSVVASVVVTALPLLSGVHLDADAQGRGVLGWSGTRGRTALVEVANVRDGQRTGKVHVLWRHRGEAQLAGLDVAASGATVVCLRERSRTTGRGPWRVRVVRRSASGNWRAPVLVAAPGKWVDDVTCGAGNAGQAVVAWTENVDGRTRAAFVSPGGKVDKPVTLARRIVGVPVAAVAPDGSGAVAFTDHERHLQLATRPAGGSWALKATAPGRADVPQLAVDAGGHRMLAWSESGSVRFAAEPNLDPTTIARGPSASVTSLTVSDRGDVLATWITKSLRLRAGLARPGASFAPAQPLGSYSGAPLAAALARDGTGAVAWMHAQRLVLRKLAADGSWAPSVTLTAHPDALNLGLAAAPSGRVTAAWGQTHGNRVQLRLGVI
jgi:hypothetical protein